MQPGRGKAAGKDASWVASLAIPSNRSSKQHPTRPFGSSNANRAGPQQDAGQAPLLLADPLTDMRKQAVQAAAGALRLRTGKGSASLPAHLNTAPAAWQQPAAQSAPAAPSPATLSPASHAQAAQPQHVAARPSPAASHPHHVQHSRPSSSASSGRGSAGTHSRGSSHSQERKTTAVEDPSAFLAGAKDRIADVLRRTFGIQSVGQQGPATLSQQAKAVAGQQPVQQGVEGQQQTGTAASLTTWAEPMQPQSHPEANRVTLVLPADLQEHQHQQYPHREETPTYSRPAQLPPTHLVLPPPAHISPALGAVPPPQGLVQSSYQSSYQPLHNDLDELQAPHVLHSRVDRSNAEHHQVAVHRRAAAQSVGVGALPQAPHPSSPHLLLSPLSNGHDLHHQRTSLAPASYCQPTLACSGSGLQQGHLEDDGDLGLSPDIHLDREGIPHLSAPPRAGCILPSPQVEHCQPGNLQGALRARHLPQETAASQELCYHPQQALYSHPESHDLVPDCPISAGSWAATTIQLTQGAGLADAVPPPNAWGGADQAGLWQQGSPGMRPQHAHDPFGLLEGSSPALTVGQAAPGWQSQHVARGAEEWDEESELEVQLPGGRQHVQNGEPFHQSSLHHIGCAEQLYLASSEAGYHTEAEPHHRFGLQGNADIHNGNTARLGSGAQYLNLPSPHISSPSGGKLWAGQQAGGGGGWGAIGDDGDAYNVLPQASMSGAYQHSVEHFPVDEHEEGIEALLFKSMQNQVQDRKRKRVRFAPTP